MRRIGEDNTRPRRRRSSLSYGLVPSQAEPVFGVSRRQPTARMVHIESLSPAAGQVFVSHRGVTMIRWDGARFEILATSAPNDAEIMRTPTNVVNRYGMDPTSARGLYSEPVDTVIVVREPLEAGATTDAKAQP